MFPNFYLHYVTLIFKVILCTITNCAPLISDTVCRLW